MKTHTIAILLTLAAMCAPSHAWGPGDTGGGEPPGPNATFEQGSQPQCFSPGDFWDEFLPTLACGYVPPVKPPTEWIPKPVPPIFVPSPPVPEPATWASMLAGLVALLVLGFRRRK